MATQNRLAPNEKFNSACVEYKVGEETVKLSPSIIRNYLVSGDGKVTDQEVVMFLNLCKYQHLNPFLREAYLIKYGSKAATIVTGKDAVMKRAMKNPSYAGQQAGVVVIGPDGGLDYRTGSMVLPGENLVGGWAKVFVKNYQEPVEAVVSFNEYAGTKADGSLNAQWSKKPGTMIRKVALVQAMREAFPEDLSGMYDTAEMGVEIDAPMDMPVPEPVEEAPEVIPEPVEELPEGF